MIEVKYIISLIPLYVGIVFLFVRVERRLSTLETHIKWIMRCLNKTNNYPMDDIKVK